MGRTLAARVGSILFLSAGVVYGADEPPPLLPPAVEGPANDSPAALPAVVEAAPATTVTTPPPAAVAPEASRPVLVLPGVTTPGNLRARPRQTPPVAARSDTPTELPELAGPNATTMQPTTRARSYNTQSSPAPRSGRTVPLETIPAEDLPEALNEPRTSTDAPVRGRSPVRTPASSDRSPYPAQRPGLFGRWLPAPMTSSRASAEPRSRGSITVEPRSDPAADAALKRRIERQIRDTLGTRLQSYEVRVVDRDVTIRARAARFWQRRSVRHSLEALPSLSGYHARVDIVD